MAKHSKKERIKKTKRELEVRDSCAREQRYTMERLETGEGKANGSNKCELRDIR